MARLNSVLLITLLVLVIYSLPSSIDARKILMKLETQDVSSLKGTLPLIEITNNNMPNIHGSGRLVAHLARNGRVLVSSNPSPGAGH